MLKLPSYGLPIVPPMARVNNSHIRIFPLGGSPVQCIHSYSHHHLIRSSGRGPTLYHQKWSPKYSTVQFKSLNMNARNPLCLVIGLPFTSYIEELSGTAVASIQRRDSRWFLPMKSPTNTSLRFLSFSNINLASNLISRKERDREPQVCFASFGLL